MALISNIRRDFSIFGQQKSDDLLVIKRNNKSFNITNERLIGLILIRLINVLLKETKLKLNFNINLDLKNNDNINLTTTDKEYEVLYILGHKFKDHKMSYLIQWTGYPRELTLEPEENLLTGCTQMLSKYNDFIQKYGNPIRSITLRQKLKKWLRSPLAGRKSISDQLMEKVLPTIGFNNEILTDFFNDLIVKNHFSKESGMNSISLNINDKLIEMDKPEAEVYVWYKLNQLWNTENSKYDLIISLVGTNCQCAPIQNKSRKTLNNLNKTFPYISYYGFKSHSSLKIDLIKRIKHLKDKSLIGIMAFQETGRYFDSLHSSVFIINRQNNGICIRYIDPWRDVGSTSFSRIIYNIFKDDYKYISESVSYGTQGSGSTCFFHSLQVIASLIDGKLIENFIWRNI